MDRIRGRIFHTEAQRYRGTEMRKAVRESWNDIDTFV